MYVCVCVCVCVGYGLRLIVFFIFYFIERLIVCFVHKVQRYCQLVTVDITYQTASIYTRTYFHM